MPLARIITESVDESLELTLHLRARGFQVETVAPGAIPQTPVDLEVRLEECAAEDVLNQAAQVADGEDLWVFVAPGALDQHARPRRAVPRYRPIAKVARARPVRPRSQEKALTVVSESAAVDDEPILCELEARNLREETTVAPPPSGRVIPISTPLATSITGGSAPILAESLPEPSTASKAGPVVEMPVRIAALEPGQTIAEPAITTHDREPGPASTQFWRLAVVCVLLAIAALWVGVNLTQQPRSAANPPVEPAMIPVPHAPASIHPFAEPPLALHSPQPAGVAVQPAAGHAASAVSSPQPPSSPRARHLSGEGIIAKDTVVFYNRRPTSAAVKPQPQTNPPRDSDPN